MSQYFTVLDCKNGIKEWVFIQHIEVFQILFAHVLQVSWNKQIRVRRGKEQMDRVVPLPDSLVEPLKKQLKKNKFYGIQ